MRTTDKGRVSPDDGDAAGFAAFFADATADLPLSDADREQIIQRLVSEPKVQARSKGEWRTWCRELWRKNKI